MYVCIHVYTYIYERADKYCKTQPAISVECLVAICFHSLFPAMTICRTPSRSRLHKITKWLQCSPPARLSLRAAIPRVASSGATIFHRSSIPTSFQPYIPYLNQSHCAINAQTHALALPHTIHTLSTLFTPISTMILCSFSLYNCFVSNPVNFAVGVVPNPFS